MSFNTKSHKLYIYMTKISGKMGKSDTYKEFLLLLNPSYVSVWFIHLSTYFYHFVRFTKIYHIYIYIYIYIYIRGSLNNPCCNCSFEPEIIKIGQSSHEMYSNNILNFQESTIILNALTKKVLKLIECTIYILAQRLECSPMAQETWVQSQVESYQRL